MSPFIWELVGYVASVLVAASLTMSNIRRLRWVNLAGAVIFVVYGALVRAWPVLAVNLFIAGVNVYRLRQLVRRQDFFTLLPVSGADPYLRKLLLFHEADIARFFPGFTADAVADTRPMFVLRNLVPVGVFAYVPLSTGEIEVKLDYVIPEYRDHKNAEFLYRILNERFAGEGYRSFVVTTSVRGHARYLEHEGFRAEPGEPQRYRKAII